MDHIDEVDVFPFMRLRTSNNSEIDYKNSKESNIYFTIDIFSKYKGEKEILEIESKIKSKVSGLMAMSNVSAVKKDTFLIMDDEDPMLKHGVLIYKIKIMEV